MLKITQESLIVPDQIFILNALHLKNLNINKSDFTRMGFSGIKVKDTNITIQDSTFSNNLKTAKNRLLAQSTDDSLYASKLREPIQFIVLDTSNSVLNSVSFSDNSLNTLVSGGVTFFLKGKSSHLTLGDSNSWVRWNSYFHRLYF